MAATRAQCSKWMDLAKGGDADAFGRLAEAMQDDIFRFARACGLAHADAAEATQETFLRAYSRRTSWRPGGDAAAWLHGFAMNVIREARRAAAKRRHSAPFECASRADRGPEIDELDRLARAMDALPDRQREAVACRYLRGMTVQETAQTMSVAEGTVKAAVFAALESLRKAMRRPQ